MGQASGPSRTSGRMSVPPGERLPAGRVASHLGVMAVVAAVMGVRRGRSGDPLRRRARASAPSDRRQDRWTTCPAELEHRAAGPADPDRRRQRQHHRHPLRREPHQRPAEPDLAEDGQGDRRDRGLPLLPARRARPEGHAARAGHQPGQRRRRPGWLVDHPADGQDDPAQPGEDQGERKAATADTYARKLTELRYAIAFEQNYSKDWILERYLNIAYFGDGAYGVQAAARHYFDTNAKDLNLLQGATLAGLVKNPTGYDPITNPDRGHRAPQRRARPDGPAQRDHPAQGRQAQEAAARPAPGRRRRNGCVNSSAPFFCDYVVNYLEQDPALGKTVDARKKLLYTGGLTIHTTIDLRDQRAADTSVRNHVFPTDQAIGALAMVEPGTGDVKAIAQSRPMGRDAKAGPDLPQLRRPAEVRRLQRLPGRARRSRRSCSPRRSSRASRSTHEDQLAACR